MIRNIVLLMLATVGGAWQMVSAQVISEKDSLTMLLTLAEAKQKQSPSEALAYCNSAFQLATTLNDQESMAQAAYLKGRVYQFRFIPDSAIMFLEQSLDLSTKTGNEKRAGLCHSALGATYSLQLPNVVKAQQHFSRALALIRTDSLERMRVINNVGVFLNRNDKFDSAIYLFKKVFHFATRRGETALATAALNNISAGYVNKEQYQEATQWYLICIDLKQKLNDHYGTASTLLNLGMAYTRTHQPARAHEALEKAFQLIVTYEFKSLEIFYRINLCELYVRTGQPDKGVVEGIKAEKLVYSENFHGYDKHLFEWLSKAYQETREYDLALTYQKKINRYNDSIANLEHKALINQAPADKKNNSNLMISPLGWIGGLFLVAAVASGALVNYRKQKKKRAESSSTPALKFKHSLEVIDQLGMKLIPMDDIAWFEKEGKLYHVHTLEDKSFRIRQTLEELEEALPADKFFRINRSVIINLQYISNYSFWENRKYIIRTKGTQQFVTSSDRVKKLKEKYNITQA